MSIKLANEFILTKRTRIAPTPSGFLHVGNALNAVLIWLWAKQNDAEIMLRVDDIDQPRVKPEFVDDVFLTLDWLGIDWDMGPSSVDDLLRNWSQVHRLDVYRDAIRRVTETGNSFNCRCSRSKWAVGGYDSCNCATIKTSDHSEHVIRMRRFPERISFKDQWMGDITMSFDRHTQAGILLRRDGMPSYQVTSVVDDVKFNISHVIRGVDLIESTATQLHLSALMSMEPFMATSFMHHPLVRFKGAKLSKSAGSTSLKHLRETGTSHREFYAWLGNCLGLDGVTSLGDLLNRCQVGFTPLSGSQDWSID